MKTALLKTYPKVAKIINAFLPFESDHGPANNEYNTPGRACKILLQAIQGYSSQSVLYKMITYWSNFLFQNSE